MENNLFYQVAGHRFRLSFSDRHLGKDGLSNYAPFLVAEGKGDFLFHLSVVDNLPDEEAYELVGWFDDDIASIRVSKSAQGHFRFHIAYPGNTDYCIMDADTAFRTAQMKLPDSGQYRFFCLNNCLMLLYAFSTARLDTLMMHASVIKNDGEGFVFLGKSGTGKSTHSRLWQEHIEDSELLNDDNPVVRIIDGKPIVSGSPWSGKTPCYRNEEALLKGIVKLHQAPENQIEKLPLLQAYATVLPACSSMQWEDGIASGVHRTVERLVSTAACYRLNCLPDKAAAELCAATIKGK